MFKTTLKKLEDTGLDNLLVLALSVLLMLVMTDFRGHAFLVEDNVRQFFPIPDKIFQNFMETGRLAIFNFHQMRGMIVADQGYYGQTNPLLFLSWLLSRYIFKSYDCITLYPIVCVALGNVFWNGLLKSCGYSASVRGLVVAMVTCVSAFFELANWYYAFNCALSVPMILYGCCHAAFSDGWRAYLWAGLSLFISLSLGNSQYTFYQYMIFGITVFVYIILSGQYKKTPRLLSNAATAIALSAPLLRLLMKAAARLKNVRTAAEFFSFPVDLAHQIFFCALPHGLLSKLANRSFWNRFTAGDINGRRYAYLYTGFFFPCVVLFAFYWYYTVYRDEINRLLPDMRAKKERYVIWAALTGSFFLLLARDKVTALLAWGLFVLIWAAFKSDANVGAYAVNEQGDDVFTFTKSVFVCIVFFMLFEMGKGFIVARVMSLIPVVKNFRHLMKITFVLSPLMAFVAAFMTNILLARCRRRKCLALLLVLFIAFGLWNNYHKVTGERHPYSVWFFTQAKELLNGNDLVREMREKRMDVRNYRLMPFYENTRGPGSHKTKLICSDYATYMGLYALGGYDGAPTLEGYGAVDKLFKRFYEYFSYSAIASKEFFELCGKDTAYAAEAIGQLISNSVKYCIFETDSPYRGDFVRWIEKDGRIAIARKIPLSIGTVLYELDGVKPLFTSASNTDASTIDEIVLKTADVVENNRIETTFAYQKKLSAYEEDASGAWRGLTVESDKNGNAVITGKNLGGTTVRLRYEDFFASATLYYGLVLSAAVLLFLLLDALFSKPKTRSLREHS